MTDVLGCCSDTTDIDLYNVRQLKSHTKKVKKGPDDRHNSTYFISESGGYFHRVFRCVGRMIGLGIYLFVHHFVTWRRRYDLKGPRHAKGL